MQNTFTRHRFCMTNLISIIIASIMLTGCPGTEQTTAAASHKISPASASSQVVADSAAGASAIAEAASIATTATATAVTTVASSGPFGLAMAISETELASKFGFVKSGKARHLFQGQPPIPVADFSDYYAVTAPISGICKVGASRTITAVSGTGEQIKAAADRIAQALEQQYGKPSLKKDKVKTDIYTRRPQFWMVGLKEGSVSYGYLWANGKTERELPDNILNIIVFAHAKAINRGEVGVSYEFANYADCQKEWRKEKGQK